MAVPSPLAQGVPGGVGRTLVPTAGVVSAHLPSPAVIRAARARFFGFCSRNLKGVREAWGGGSLFLKRAEKAGKSLNRAAPRAPAGRARGKRPWVGTRKRNPDKQGREGAFLGGGGSTRPLGGGN